MWKQLFKGWTASFEGWSEAGDAGAQIGIGIEAERLRRAQRDGGRARQPSRVLGVAAG